MTYYVIVCPDKYCRGVSIIKEKHNSVTCRKCDSVYKLDRYRISYESDSREKAVKARTKLLLKINDDERSYEDLEEKGMVEKSEKAYSKRADRDSRNPKTIVRSTFKKFEKPTESDILEESTKSSKIDKEKAKKIVKSMIREGEVIRTKDGLEKI